MKFALLLVAPLMRTDPTVFSLVVSRWVSVTPGSITIMPNKSRPFKVMFPIWLLSISLELSLEAVWMADVVAVTDTFSVIAPSDRVTFPRSRTSLAVTSIADCVYVLKPAEGVMVRSYFAGTRLLKRKMPQPRSPSW